MSGLKPTKESVINITCTIAAEVGDIYTYYFETKTLKSPCNNSICGTCLVICLAILFPLYGTELFVFSITFSSVILQHSKQNMLRLVAKCYVVGR